MNPLLLYLLLLKATVLSFSGLSSVAIIRDDLVVNHAVINDNQLNTALVAGRVGPGPLGLYVVSVGYFAGGWPGAAAGSLAMVTPAFLIIPMLRYLGARAERPLVQRVIKSVTVASAGLILASTAPLASEALTGPAPVVIAVAALAILVLTRIESIWIFVGAAVAGLASTLLPS
jgi:chromate transporter